LKLRLRKSAQPNNRETSKGNRLEKRPEVEVINLDGSENGNEDTEIDNERVSRPEEVVEIETTNEDNEKPGEKEVAENEGPWKEKHFSASGRITKASAKPLGASNWRLIRLSDGRPVREGRQAQEVEDTAGAEVKKEKDQVSVPLKLQLKKPVPKVKVGFSLSSYSYRPRIEEAHV